MFQHFVISRFNLKIKDWDTTTSGAPVLTKEWMERRFKLFLDYCLPSMANQSNQNFHWLPYLDTDTDPYYKDQMKQLEEKYPFIATQYAPDHNAFYTNMDGDIRKLLKKDTEYVITTRFDNDDLMHREFIASIQAAFQPVAYQVINLATGYNLQLEPFQGLAEFHMPQGTFVSMVERLSEKQPLKTVYNEPHNQYIFTTNVVQVQGEPRWMQLEHDYNTYNLEAHFYGKPIWDKRKLRDFALDESAFRFSAYHYLRRLGFYSLAAVTPKPVKRIVRELIS